MCKRNKTHLPDKSRLVNKKRLIKVYKTREEKIANFYKDYEHYQDSIKLLLSIQQCAFTSAHYKSLSDFEQEELQLRFPKVMELIMDLGRG